MQSEQASEQVSRSSRLYSKKWRRPVVAKFLLRQHHNTKANDSYKQCNAMLRCTPSSVDEIFETLKAI